MDETVEVFGTQSTLFSLRGTFSGLKASCLSRRKRKIFLLDLVVKSMPTRLPLTVFCGDSLTDFYTELSSDATSVFTLLIPSEEDYLLS